MSDGDGKITWGLLKEVAQFLIYPLFAAVFYVVVVMSGFDKRLSVLEVSASRPQTDVALAQKLAVIEDRQNNVIKQLAENGARIDRLSEKLDAHDDRWDEPTRRRR